MPVTMDDCVMMGRCLYLISNRSKARAQSIRDGTAPAPENTTDVVRAYNDDIYSRLQNHVNRWYNALRDQAAAQADDDSDVMPIVRDAQTPTVVLHLIERNGRPNSHANPRLDESCWSFDGRHLGLVRHLDGRHLGPYIRKPRIQVASIRIRC